MPAHNVYGTWPASGEIDMAESRGNKRLIQNGQNIGVTRIGSTLHFGPSTPLDGWPRAHFNTDNSRGYNEEFKKYQLEWTPSMCD